MKNYIRFNKKSQKLETYRSTKKPSGNWKLVTEDSCANCDILNVENNPALDVIWITDFHARLDEPRYSYMKQRVPVLVDAINSRGYDFIIDSGDSLEGNTGVGKGTLDQQVSEYDGLFRSKVLKPVYNTLGNHDFYGTGFPMNDAIEALRMPSAYYYKDFKNWRFIFLSSFEGNGTPIRPHSLGATQLAWLTNLLAQSTDKYVCLISHIPIISIGAMLWYVYNGSVNPTTTTTWNMTIDQHVDVYAILELIRANPNIRACLAGHTHTYDECMYPAVGNCKFFLGGSACGFYWNTGHNWVLNYTGFNHLRFFGNGNVTREIVYY